MWLSLLKHGKLLVLKGGIHQFMLQPGVVDVYRKEAMAFASAAQWGNVGEVPAEAAAAAEEGQQQKDSVVTHDGVALLAGPDRDTPLPSSSSVGLGEVFKNLWAQRGNKK